MIDIDALEAALAAATPGPWRTVETSAGIHKAAISVEECGRAIETIASCYCGAYDGHGLHNARAIVALRNAWPAVSAELRGLRAIADLADVLLISERERRNGRPETTARLAAMLQDRREGRRG